MSACQRLASLETWKPREAERKITVLVVCGECSWQPHLEERGGARIKQRGEVEP